MIASAPIGPVPVTSTRLPQQGPGLPRRMQADGKRLGKGGDVQIHAGRHRESLRLGADQDLAKPALHMRHAHGAAVEPHVEAVIGLAGQAKPAMAARQAGVDRHMVAGPHTRHLGSHIGHLASDFVAQDHRLLDAHRAEAAMAVIMQVRPANPASANPHRHIVRPHGGDLRLLDAQVAGCVDDCGLHRLAPERGAGDCLP